jgi:hypothetical protein
MMAINQSHFPRRKFHIFLALCVTTAAGGIFCSSLTVGTEVQITHLPGLSFLRRRHYHKINRLRKYLQGGHVPKLHLVNILPQ